MLSLALHWVNTVIFTYNEKNLGGCEGWQGVFMTINDERTFQRIQGWVISEGGYVWFAADLRVLQFK